MAREEGGPQDSAGCQGSEHWGVDALDLKGVLIGNQESCREAGWEEQWPRWRDTVSPVWPLREGASNKYPDLSSPLLPLSYHCSPLVKPPPQPATRASIKGQFPGAQSRMGTGREWPERVSGRNGAQILTFPLVSPFILTAWQRLSHRCVSSHSLRHLLFSLQPAVELYQLVIGRGNSSAHHAPIFRH